MSDYMDRHNTATCSTCGRSYDPDNIKESHPFRHPVDGALSNRPEEQEPEQELMLPSDPILRLVLIEKGIIKVTDLTEAEQKLKASGAVIANPETAPKGLRAKIAEAQRGR